MEITRTSPLVAGRPLEEIPSCSCLGGGPTHQLFLEGSHDALEVKSPERLRFWEQTSYIRITVDFLDRRGNQTFAVTQQSARAYLIRQGAHSVREVAGEFFAHPSIQSNQRAIYPAAIATQAFAARANFDFNQYVRPNLELISTCSQRYNLSFERVALVVVKAHILKHWVPNGFSFHELVAILCYVEANPPLGQETRRIPAQENLPRTLIYSKGKVLVVFNKHGRAFGKRDPLVGQGGYSRVKGALDLETCEEYVVVVQDDTFVARNALSIHQELQGPGVALIHDAITWTCKKSGKPKLAMIMPRYLGDARSQVSLTSSPLPLSSKRHIAIDVLEAVARMHAQGVIHRDIKPENILIDARLRGYLTDFGLSDRIGDVKPPKGTPEFIAPELTLSPQIPATPAVDNWALGLVLWWLFTSEIAFSGAFHPGATYEKFILEEKWRFEFTTADWLGGAPQSISPEAEIVRCLLHPDPSLRMTAAQALSILRPPAIRSSAPSASSHSTLTPIPPLSVPPAS